MKKTRLNPYFISKRKNLRANLFDQSDKNCAQSILSMTKNCISNFFQKNEKRNVYTSFRADTLNTSVVRHYKNMLLYYIFCRELKRFMAKNNSLCIDLQNYKVENQLHMSR
jgi:hypothetical protein